MKKKLFGSLSTILLSGVLLIGCGSQLAEAPTETDESEEIESTEIISEEKVITVDISVDGEKLEELSKELTVEDEIDLLEIMDTNYDIDATTDGFMTGIEGYEQDESESLYWMFYVNEELGEVGAADYIPAESDAIDWKLESFD